MPMDPMDAMWMSKAPTVSELVGKSNVTFKSAVAATPVEDGIRPDYDTDVLWKPPRLARKQRTVSVDSTDSEMNPTGRKFSLSESVSSNSPMSSPVEMPGRQRRMSISEMIFGSPTSAFSWTQSTTTTNTTTNGEGVGQRRNSVTEDVRFKELIKSQNRVFGDGNH